MSTRDHLLDAFVQILLDEGERAATLDAVASRAKVSKGGLLYHFPGKDALMEGLLERLRRLAEDDIAAMRTAPEGAAAHYIASSAFEGSPFDQALVATALLSQNAHPAATAALRSIQHTWLDLIIAEVGDPVVARTILLIGDGLYYNAALGGLSSQVAGTPDGVSTTDLLEVVALLKNQVRPSR